MLKNHKWNRRLVHKLVIEEPKKTINFSNYIIASQCWKGQFKVTVDKLKKSKQTGDTLNYRTSVLNVKQSCCSSSIYSRGIDKAMQRDR